MIMRIYRLRNYRKRNEKLDAKDVLPNIHSHKPHAGRRKGRKMPLMSMVTLTFKLVRARDQRRLPGEFGANPFSGSRDISYTNKKVTDSAKNRTLHSSVRALKMPKFGGCAFVRCRADRTEVDGRKDIRRSANRRELEVIQGDGKNRRTNCGISLTRNSTDSAPACDLLHDFVAQLLLRDVPSSGLLCDRPDELVN